MEAMIGNNYTLHVLVHTFLTEDADPLQFG